MPKSSAVTPIRHYTPHKPFKLRKRDWCDLESAYGVDLPNELRAEIQYVTDVYLFWAQLEGKGTHAPISKSISRVRSLRKAAVRLLKTIGEHGDEIREYIDYQMSAPNEVNQSRTSGALARHVKDLELFIQRCDAALLLMKKDSQAGFWQQGAAWDNWISVLGRCARRYGLPDAASKGQAKSKSAKNISPFAAFVWELQKKIPQQYRRSTHSKGALSQAISRAKRSPRRQHRAS